MRYVKKGLVVLCVFLSANTWANSHKEAAYDLIDAMNLNQLMSETIDSMLAVQLQAQPQLQPFQGTMKEFFNTYMSGDSLRDDFALLYQSAYTEQELNELAAFLQSPTGQKSLKLSPMLTAQGAQIGQKRVMENAHILEQMIKEEAERIQAAKN